jgi:hypothetical protein
MHTAIVMKFMEILESLAWIALGFVPTLVFWNVLENGQSDRQEEKKNNRNIAAKNDQIRQNDLPMIFNKGVMASDTLYI